MLAAGLWLAACSDEPGAPLPAGEAEYKRFCSTCHGRDGTGSPPNFPPLAGSQWLDLGPEAIALVALLGLRGEIEVAGETYRGYMPNMRQVDDDEMVRLLGYIAEQWAGWDAVPNTDEVARLRQAANEADILNGREDLEALLDRVTR